MSNNYLQYLSSFGSAIKRFVSPDLPGAEPITLQYAKSIVSRERLTQILGFKDYDETRKLVILDDGTNLSVGFMFELKATNSKSVEQSTQAFAELIGRCPEGAFLQFSKLNTPEIADSISKWAHPLTQADNIYSDFFKAKVTHLQDCAKGPSAIVGQDFHPRLQRRFLALRMPFNSQALEKNQVNEFFDAVVNIREEILASLPACGFEGLILNELQFKELVKELLNPHIDRVSETNQSGDIFEDLIDEQTEISFEKAGYIGFQKKGEPVEVAVIPMTLDTLTENLNPMQMYSALEGVLGSEDHISAPYFAYTQIQVISSSTAKEILLPPRNKLKKNLNVNTSQIKAEAPTFYSNQEFNTWLEEQLQKGVQFVRGHTGINLYCHPSEVAERCTQVKQQWRKAGLKLSEEKFIGFPVFASTLPLVYSEGLDPFQGGLQRGACMTAERIAKLLPIGESQSDLGFEKANLLLTTRQAKIQGLDTQGKALLGVGVSVAGKAAVAKELIYEVCARGGQAQVIDFGGAYRRLAKNIEGKVLPLSTENPLNLSPFLTIESIEQIKAQSPMLAQWIFDLLKQPAGSQEAILEVSQAIEAAWLTNKTKTMLADVADILAKSERPATAKLAQELLGFLNKKTGIWFKQKDSAQMIKRNPGTVCVYELSEIVNEPVQRHAALKGILWAMLTNSSETPTLTIVDEADVLLQGEDQEILKPLSSSKSTSTSLVFCNGFEEISKSKALKSFMAQADALMIFQQNGSYTNLLKADNNWEWTDEEIKALARIKSNETFAEFYWKQKGEGQLLRLLLSKTAQLHFTNNGREIARIEQAFKLSGNLRKAYQDLQA